MDLRKLPARPDLDHYRKQAKALVKAHGAGHPAALGRIHAHHPVLRKLDLAALAGVRFQLADAQLVLAREHGFESWPKFRDHVEALRRSASPASRFEHAADAIADGDLETLAHLTGRDPDLVRTRSERWHRATLLHYVGANGVEGYRQKTPPNILEIARLLLARGAEVDAVAEMYAGNDTAFTLAATSIHPAASGVLEELLDLLLAHGAAVDGPPGAYPVVNACLANGRPQGAHLTAARGARLDLEGAAGVGDLERVRSFFAADGELLSTATAAQRDAGFMWACEYGHDAVADFLLDRGVPVMTEVRGMTGPHWAVTGWQDSTLRLLLARGAQLEARNRYGGTLLGNAVWAVFHSHPVHRWPRGDGDYLPTLRLLLDSGADVHAADYPTGNPRVDELLRAYRAGE